MRSGTSTDSVNCNDDSVSEFDVSTCPGDSFYDIFENEEEIITEDSIFWVNTRILFWKGRFIKIFLNDSPEDSNY